MRTVFSQHQQFDVGLRPHRCRARAVQKQGNLAEELALCDSTITRAAAMDPLNDSSAAAMDPLMIQLPSGTMLVF